MLSGTAFLAACGVRPQATLYGGPPPDDSTEIKQACREQALRERIDAIRAIVEKREHSEVYGSPEVIWEYREETDRLRAEADSLSKELDSLQSQTIRPRIDPRRGREAVPLYGAPRPKTQPKQ